MKAEKNEPLLISIVLERGLWLYLTNYHRSRERFLSASVRSSYQRCLFVDVPDKSNPWIDRVLIHWSEGVL